MGRRLLKIEYDGTNFCGWQLQPDVRTVQGELERAVSKAAGKNTRTVLHGAGRTDAGVHALSQMAHFDSHSSHSCHTYLHAINFWLSTHDISVRAIYEVPDNFHARFDAVKKTYRYSIILSETKRPLFERYCTRIDRKVDINSLNSAAELIKGTHDFASFTASGGDTESTVRTIFNSHWIREGDMLNYFIEGSGFTYNMVRNLVGSMTEVGCGGFSLKKFESILECNDRKQAGPTAPPGGLMLYEICYGRSLSLFNKYET